MTFPIETLSTRASPADRAALVTVLREAILGGASVGFVQPIDEAEIVAYWRAVLREARAGHRIVLVARDAGEIVGTVQLELAAKANAQHRAEVQKLLVRSDWRGRGIGSALLAATETAARENGRSLLVLDTSATGNALGLYDRAGYTRAGVIPRYASDPNGPLVDTVIYYKELALAGRDARRPGVLELRPA